MNSHNFELEEHLITKARFCQDDREIEFIVDPKNGTI